MKDIHPANYNFVTVPIYCPIYFKIHSILLKDRDAHLMASFQEKHVRQHRKDKLTILDFNEARNNRVAVASDKPHANHMHFAPER